jgi:hypothetical protein
MRIFNISTRRIGGLRFLKVGRLTLSWSVSRAYRSLHAAKGV